LIEDLRPGPVALDTQVFIYFIEEDPRFIGVVDALFRAIDAGALRAVTSAVTLLECLVVPYRTKNRRLAQRYEALLTGSRGLLLVDLDRALVRTAAELRATFGLKTPDALQIAAALRVEATAFVTSDRRLPAVPGLEIVQLASLPAEGPGRL